MKNCQPPSSIERILSLDVFRGITMAFMVLVGNPGSIDIYRQLDHAPWRGWTVTDTVFPTFLWIAGMSLYIAFRGKLARGGVPFELIVQLLKRCALLFLIGVMIYAISDFHPATFRIMGVLQRIALCSFAAGLVCFLPRRWLPLLVAILLIAHWIVTHHLAAPGFAVGDMSVEGNYAHYVDRVILGRHNYSGTGSWDPEGLLTTIPAIATTLFGLVAGAMMERWEGQLTKQVMVLLAAGVLLIATGLCLSHWDPINKKLWTVSYCLLMAGIDFAVFGALRYLIDGLKPRYDFSIQLAFGRNALAVYILSECLGALLYRVRVGSQSLHELIFNTVFAGRLTGKMDSLLFALSFLALITLAALFMQRHRWILKL